jgi:hypothetical protein
MNRHDTKAVGVFGRKLRRVLHSRKGWRILECWGCSWTDGGCLVLAKALCLWLGEGKVAGIWEGRIQHHAVLSIGRWIVDGDGVADSGSFLKLWSEREGYVGTKLADFDFQVAGEQYVKEDCGLEREVVSLLDSKFDSDRMRMALTA